MCVCVLSYTIKSFTFFLTLTLVVSSTLFDKDYTGVCYTFVYIVIYTRICIYTYTYIYIASGKDCLLASQRELNDSCEPER